MDFFVSRVPIPSAVILYAKGEIGTVGQDVLCDAIIAELNGTCPIILDVRDVRYVVERQISGPILNARIGSYYSGKDARKVAVVGADSVMGKFLEERRPGDHPPPPGLPMRRLRMAALGEVRSGAKPQVGGA